MRSWGLPTTLRELEELRSVTTEVLTVLLIWMLLLAGIVCLSGIEAIVREIVWPIIALFSVPLLAVIVVAVHDMQCHGVRTA